jgi:hypothetical protein
LPDRLFVPDHGSSSAALIFGMEQSGSPQMMAPATAPKIPPMSNTIWAQLALGLVAIPW